LNCKSQFEQEVLQAHNLYRAKHGAQPLTLSPKLNRLATEWANVSILQIIN